MSENETPKTRKEREPMPETERAVRDAMRDFLKTVNVANLNTVHDAIAAHFIAERKRIFGE